MAQVELRGLRVRLRPWRPDDLDEFAALNADLRVMEFFPAVLSRDETAAALARVQAVIAERGWGWWCLDVDGGCAGFVGLSQPNFEAHFTPCVEVGWRLAHRCWGRGYAVEGARLALAYGFEVLGLPEIVAFTAQGNQRSQRVMEKLGMTHDATDDFDHPRLPEGHALRRHVLYRLKREARP
ncbi:MAG: GNAT family N-acetyltransferase [Burkholderiales bacterium]|jgi:RimJ/RimL family protein N-acetyltransferase|nr:GNAT family N-acetyltransferase [Burkholderiales bacterium]